jgi:predicted HAD superfamily Cof-like phosphohydrolase
LNIVDPSNYATTHLTEIQKSVIKEIVHMANGAAAYEDWACEAINDIHKLADKYNGSVSQRDADIKSLLFFICVDLSRHQDPVKKLREDAKQNTKN